MGVKDGLPLGQCEKVFIEMSLDMHPHDYAYVEAEKINILHTVVSPDRTAHVRASLMQVAVDMLEDALGTIWGLLLFREDFRPNL